MLFPSQPADTRSRLLKTIAETGRDVMGSTQTEDVWTAAVRQGLYHVAIRHHGDARYMEVIFPVRLTDAAALEKINAVLEHPQERAGFEYQLKRILSTPQTSFRIHLVGDRFAGFDTSTKIYPFDSDFSACRLDAALQGVVSTGIVGIAFIATIVDGREVGQQADAYFAQASPEGMYG